MNIALLLGAGVGLGIWLVILGLVPPRPLLAEGLRRLRLQPEPPPIAAAPETPPGPLIRLGAPIARALAPRLRSEASWLVPGFVSGTDLAILGRTAERHLAEKIGVAICGLLLPAALAGILYAEGVTLPPLLPFWVAIVVGVLGFLLPDLVVRSGAGQARREFRDVLAAFVQVVALSLTADNGLQTALGDGAAAGAGWGFDRLQGAIRQARYGAETPWSALGRLGSGARGAGAGGAGRPGVPRRG